MLFYHTNVFEICFKYIISYVVNKLKYFYISFSDRDSHIVQLSGIRGQEKFHTYIIPEKIMSLNA